MLILKRDAGMEPELELEIGMTSLAVRASVSGILGNCGFCGNLNGFHSHSSERA